MRTDITIRPAAKADIPALLSLNAQLQSWHAGHYPDLFLPQADQAEITRLFATWCADETALLLVSEAGTTVTGYVYATRKDEPQSWYAHAHTLFQIEHIVVAKPCRSMGHGKALMQAALDAAPRGPQVIVSLTSWAANTDAHAFFARFGFAPSYINFAMPRKENGCSKD